MSNSAQIINGKVVANYSADNSSKPATGSDSLNKDAFLKILVAEMQYQDPLEPSSNTDWVNQMASFSQIESLNDISSTMSTLKDTANESQAVGLVGKRVILTEKDENTGEISYVTGIVQCLEKKEDGIKLSVNGYLYPVSSLYSVVDEDYYNSLMEKGEA